MAAEYSPPESELVRTRALARRLLPIGVILAGLGAAGIILASVLKVVWLGMLGGPVGALSWLTLLAGMGCSLAGFLMARSTRRR